MTPRTEPVITSDIITGLIMSVIVFLVGRGLIGWTETDQANFFQVLAYGVPLAITLVGGLVARQFTTSLANPRMSKDDPLMTRREWMNLMDLEEMASDAGWDNVDDAERG